MASKLAWAGLLGATADAANRLQARSDALEERKYNEAQQTRKEEAILARSKALAKYNAELGENVSISREQRADERDIAREKRAMTANVEMEKMRSSRPSDKQRMLLEIENDPSLSDEEKKQARLAVYGISTEKKGQVSESQRYRIEDNLAKLEDLGIDETNINQANRYREQLGMKPLVRSEVTPAKKGGFFSSDTPAEYEYIEREDSGPGGLSKYQQLLQQAESDGTIGIGKSEQPMEKIVNVGKGGLLQQGQEQPKPAGIVSMNQEDSIEPEKIAELKKMTMPQLQAFRQGVINSGESETEQGKEMLKIINQLIAEKGQLGQ